VLISSDRNILLAFKILQLYSINSQKKPSDIQILLAASKDQGKAAQRNGTELVPV